MRRVGGTGGDYRFFGSLVMLWKVGRERIEHLCPGVETHL